MVPDAVEVVSHSSSCDRLAAPTCALLNVLYQGWLRVGAHLSGSISCMLQPAVYVVTSSA